MGLLNTYEVAVKVYVDVEASSEMGAADDAQETLEELLLKAGLPAYCKINDVRQKTDYR